MVEGWIEHTGERHHGAHGGLAARTLGVPEGDFLDFSQNVNPLGPPAGALAAAREALVRESGRYPDLGYPELREALAGYLGVSPDIVLPTNGGAEALFLAARTAARRQGRALVLEPTFSEYTAAARAAGLEPVRRVARVPQKRGLRFDPSALGDLDGVALVFISNPNNPTGDALSKREVLELADRVRAAGATLVVDEAFADFLPEASVAGNVEEGLYVARSFTKFFAVPGLRLGCLLATDPGKLQAFQPSWSVNVVAAAAGIAATGDATFIEASRVEVTRLRSELLASLNAMPALAAFAGVANFLLVRGPEGLPERLARRGVLVRGCEPFMGLGAEYFRVAVRGAEEKGKLLEALREEL